MPSAQRSIKIIKRECREALAEQRENAELCLKSEFEIRQEILGTVTSWIERQREAKKELLKQSVARTKLTLFKPVTCVIQEPQSEPEPL